MAGKPKLAICISYFNNKKEIPRLLDPIVEHVDLIIAIDGRYPLFDWPTNISTDGSTELLIEKYNAVVQVNKSPIEQIDKRNQYLEIARNACMDWVLVLDTDDYIHKTKRVDWDLFYEQLETIVPEDEYLANVWFWMNPKWRKNFNLVKNNTWNLYTRLIRPDKIQYHTTHWTYTLRDNPVMFEIANNTVNAIKFNSDSTLRPEKYIRAGTKWAKQQMLEENDRMETPVAKRMKFNFHFKQIKKILVMPNIKVIEGKEELEKLDSE